MAKPSWILIEHLRGVSSGKIAQQFEEITTADQVEEMIALAKKKFEASALDKIIKRAMEGDLSAVDWLESRGLISLPGKLEDGS